MSWLGEVKLVLPRKISCHYSDALLNCKFSNEDHLDYLLAVPAASIPLQLGTLCYSSIVHPAMRHGVIVTHLFIWLHAIRTASLGFSLLTRLHNYLFVAIQPQ